MANSEELINNAEYLTLQTTCHTNQCWRKQVRMYISYDIQGWPSQKRMKWVWHIACVSKQWSAHEMLPEKP